MSALSDPTHVLDSLPAHALASLEPEEARHVEEHLQSCWICRSEFLTLQGVVQQLSFAAPVVGHSPDLKQRLMQRAQNAKVGRVPVPTPGTVSARPFWERLLPAWGLASLILIVGLAAATLVLWQRVGELQVATSPAGMRAVPLSAPDAASRATGFVLISPDGSDGALVVDGLPELPAGQEYQLWLIRDGQRVSGAVFSTDENHYGGTRIRAPRSLLDYSAAGVTIEPEGGSEEPTGPQVLTGPLIAP